MSTSWDILSPNWKHPQFKSKVCSDTMCIISFEMECGWEEVINSTFRAVCALPAFDFRMSSSHVKLSLGVVMLMFGCRPSCEIIYLRISSSRLSNFILSSLNTCNICLRLSVKGPRGPLLPTEWLLWMCKPALSCTWTWDVDRSFPSESHRRSGKRKSFTISGWVWSRRLYPSEALHNFKCDKQQAFEYKVKIIHTHQVRQQPHTRTGCTVTV